MSHYHTGYGLSGYGPETESVWRADTIESLACDVRTRLEETVDTLTNEAADHRDEARELRGRGADWSLVAERALDSLAASEMADAADTMARNLNPQRARAPLYAGAPALWDATLRRLLLDSDTFPLPTSVTGASRLYVWRCGNWRCMLSEHDADYTLPDSGSGYVCCPCRDCFEIVCWSPDSGQAPYCPGCETAECGDRTRGECGREDAGDGHE